MASLCPWPVRLTLFFALSLLVLDSAQLAVLADSSSDKNQWNREKWLRSEWDCSRPKLFAQLLTQRNLIGLSRQKIEKLIGAPDCEGGYRIEHSCGGAILLRLDYKKDRLKRWRLESCGYNGHAALTPEQWIESNVVLFEQDRPFALIPLRTVPKSK